MSSVFLFGNGIIFGEYRLQSSSICSFFHCTQKFWFTTNLLLLQNRAVTFHPNKSHPIRPRRPRRGVEVELYSFFNLGARWGRCSRPLPGRLTPGEDPVPIGLGGPHSRSGRVRKISPPTGIRSPDRPARSESLSRPLITIRQNIKNFRWKLLKYIFKTCPKIADLLQNIRVNP